MIEIKCVEEDIALKWFMVRFCNFNCNGCIEGASNQRVFDKAMIQQQTEQAYQTGQKILNYFKSYSNRTLKLTLTGGECSLLDLQYIFSNWSYYGEGNTLHIQMITNFSASNNKYKQLFKMFDEYGITYKLTVSIHEQYWVKENVINKIKELKNNISCLNYVVTNNNVDIIEDYFNSLQPFTKQRLGISRNKAVEYNVNDKVWNLLKRSPVKQQMRWTENGILERLDMDTMFHERIDPEGFYGWTCWPLVKIKPDGTAFICRKTEVELDRDKVPETIICHRCGKCTPYNWTKVRSDED